MNKALDFLILSWIFCAFFVQTTFGQSKEIEVSINAVPILNPKDNSFIIFGDSTFYYEYKIDGSQWRKKPYHYQGTIPFTRLQELYLPIVTENGSIYFVDKGVGEVYKLVDDTLKRIDRSFRHQNQFDCTMFTHQNKIYCFGGYGLFTVKNIVTCYDEKLSEWFCLDVPCNAPSPEPRLDNICRKIGDKLYVAQGACKTNTGLLGEMYEKVWEFDLNQKKWTEIGVFHEGNSNKFNNVLRHHSDFIGRWNTTLFDFDFGHNVLKTYTEIAYASVDLILRDTTGEYLCVIKTPSLNYKYVFVVPKAKFLNNPKTSAILKPNRIPIHPITTLLIFLFVMLSLTLVFIYRRKRKTKLKGLLMNQFGKFWIVDGIYYFNNQMLEVFFEPLEIKLLNQFFSSPEYTLELAGINTIFEFDEAGHETIKKRREACVKSLREKLTEMSFLSANEIFIVSKNPIDKRIKLLKLNPQLIA